MASYTVELRPVERYTLISNIAKAALCPYDVIKRTSSIPSPPLFLSIIKLGSFRHEIIDSGLEILLHLG